MSSKQAHSALRLQLAWAPLATYPCGWSGLADQLRSGAAAASTFLTAHAEKLRSTFQLESATPTECQQVMFAIVSRLCHHMPGCHPSPSTSTGGQLPHLSLSASLNAITAGMNLLHALDAASPNQTSMEQGHSQVIAASPQQALDNGMPNGSAMYAITEGIRASSLSLQPGSIRRDAVDFANLIPQMQQLTADAQPLAYEQLLRSFEPAVAVLLSWHHSLQPYIQQHCSMLISPTEPAMHMDHQLTAALFVDLLALYIASLAEMLHSCRQLPQPQTAAILLLSRPLLNWTQQLFRSLIALAQLAITQLEATLRCSDSSHGTVQKLLNLGLPMHQVPAILHRKRFTKQHVLAVHQ